MSFELICQNHQPERLIARLSTLLEETAEVKTTLYQLRIQVAPKRILNGSPALQVVWATLPSEVKTRHRREVSNLRSVIRQIQRDRKYAGNPLTLSERVELIRRIEELEMRQPICGIVSVDMDLIIRMKQPYQATFNLGRVVEITL